MSNPLRIQIAIQGGGAKIIGLVAAMEGVQELEAHEQIQGTRLAGTSAGAIVAALFSARVPMGQLRVSLGTGELRDLFQSYKSPGIMDILKGLASGTPICDPTPIRDFLRKLFNASGKEHIKDLKPPVHIVSADVAS